MCSATTFDGSCRRRCGCCDTEGRVRRRSNDASVVRLTDADTSARSTSRASTRRASDTSSPYPRPRWRRVIRSRARRRDTAPALVVEMASGCPSHRQIRLLRRALRLRRRVWVLLAGGRPRRERHGGPSRQLPPALAVIKFYRFVAEPVMRVAAGPRRVSYALRDMPTREMPGWIVRRIGRSVAPGERPSAQSRPQITTLRRWKWEPQVVQPPMVRHAQRLGASARGPTDGETRPVSAVHPSARSTAADPRMRPYLRTDFWAPMISGGSYGHTCYVAKELAAVTESFVCVMANPFPMLDEFGLGRSSCPGPAPPTTRTTSPRRRLTTRTCLRPVFEELRPAYIYERLCLGNSAGRAAQR